jgi:hypothetical protein
MTSCGLDQALERFRIIKPFLEEDVALATIAQQHRIPLRIARDKRRGLWRWTLSGVESTVSRARGTHYEASG